MTITPALVEQARIVSTMLDEGHGNAAIAEALGGVTRPRVSQIRAVLPLLVDYPGRPDPLTRLASHRTQLARLRHEALRLSIAIRRDIAELDAAADSHRIDRILGLTG